MSEHSERWLPVPGYEGLYEVSDLGRVRSLPRNTTRGKVLKQANDGGGYLFVGLSRNGRTSLRKVHHLVLEAFSGPRPEGMQGCHGPGGRSDNRATQIYWGTLSRNYGADKVRDGTDSNGERNGRAKLTAAIVIVARRRSAAGMATNALAREYGVHPKAMKDAITGKHWRSVS